MPQLQIMVQGELDLAYPESFIDLAGWDLLAHGAELPGFTVTEQPDSHEFDIAGDHLVYSHVAPSLELALDGATNGTRRRWHAFWTGRPASRTPVRKTILNIAGASSSIWRASGG